MCNTDPLNISVVMPVLNREDTVYKSIQSILDQTYPHFEVIIVDDGSTDRTIDIIHSIDDPRIRLFQSPTTLGASAARNMGVKQAEFDWIAFQDSDDHWLPNKLEKQISLLQEKSDRNSLSVIYTAFKRYRLGREEYIPADSVERKNGDIHKELLLGNFISTQTVLLPKEALEDVGGFSEDMPRFQDWELWLRMSRKYHFYCVDESLVEVYYTEDSISAEHTKLLLAYEKIIAKHETLFQNAGSNYYAGLLFSYGHNLCLAGKMREGRKYLSRSLAHHPKLLKSYASFIISFFGGQFYRKIYALYDR